MSTTDKAGRKRLATVARILERYGARVQKSVFEVRLPERSIQMIRQTLTEVMDPNEDSLRLYRVDEVAADSAEHWGAKPQDEFLGQLMVF